MKRGNALRTRRKGGKGNEKEEDVITTACKRDTNRFRRLISEFGEEGG